jgi:curved DNA-binding protein CbpA
MVINGNKPTYYKVLGLSEDATPQQIRKAFRANAWKYHPDGRTPDVEKFKQFSEAYTTLDNPAKRKSYDLALRAYRLSKTKEPNPKTAIKRKKTLREEEADLEEYIRKTRFKGPEQKPGQSKADSQKEKAAFGTQMREQHPPQKQTQTRFSGKPASTARPIFSQEDIQKVAEGTRARLEAKAAEEQAKNQQSTTPQASTVASFSPVPKPSPTPETRANKSNVAATVATGAAIGGLSIIALPFITAGAILVAGGAIIGWFWLFAHCFVLWLLVTIIACVVGFALAHEYL